eukprot:m51a1_g3326 putative protein disulfide isomerase (474) ;mRNA; f:364489-365986
MRTAVVVAALVALTVAGDVLQLTKSSFDSTVNNEDLILVKFFAPWCGHCKKLAPEYEKAATILLKEDPPVKLAEVDATVESDLASRFGVTGYPTLKLFRRGTEAPYSGPRDADGIVRYMRSQNGPAAKALATADAVDKFLGAVKDDVSVIGFFSKAGTPAEKAFQSLASALREDYRFAVVSDEAVIKAKNGGKEGVFVFLPYPGEESPVEVANAAIPAMTSALHRAAVPLAGVYKAAFAKRYDAVGLPRVTAWAKISEDDPSGTKYIVNRLRKAGKEFKGRLVFVAADRSDKDYSELGFAADAKISLGVIANGQRFKGEAAAFSVEAARKLAREYLEGKLERHIKSEPVPAKNDEDVLTVVGKTFEDEVVKSGRDTMLLFYAPWCGHCKALHPKYDELAKKLAPHKDLVRIAKIDATANEYPPHFKVNGFPTMYFVKASDPAHPVEYNGDREVADLEKFVRAQTTKTLPKQEL